MESAHERRALCDDKKFQPDSHCYWFRLFIIIQCVCFDVLHFSMSTSFSERLYHCEQGHCRMLMSHFRHIRIFILQSHTQLMLRSLNPVSGYLQFHRFWVGVFFSFLDFSVRKFTSYPAIFMFLRVIFFFAYSIILQLNTPFVCGPRLASYKYADAFDKILFAIFLSNLC